MHLSRQPGYTLAEIKQKHSMPPAPNYHGCRRQYNSVLPNEHTVTYVQQIADILYCYYYYADVPPQPSTQIQCALHDRFV